MDITFQAAVAKPVAVEAARKALESVTLPDVNVFLDAALAQALCMPERVQREETPALFVVFGGDGTILASAANAALSATPVIGVNIGRMGFLSEIEPDGVDLALHQWAKGDYILEKRMMLEARFAGGACAYALNDIAVIKQAPHNVVYLEALVCAQLAMQCACDGMLVSTPTGSTAYALSAGGPLMMPNMRSMLIQPICAHSIGARPLLTDGDDEVTMRVSQDSRGAQAFCDGRFVVEMPPGAACGIRRAPFEACFIRFSQPEFPSRVRRKLFS